MVAKNLALYNAQDALFEKGFSDFSSDLKKYTTSLENKSDETSQDSSASYRKGASDLDELASETFKYSSDLQSYLTSKTEEIKNIAKENGIYLRDMNTEFNRFSGSDAELRVKYLHSKRVVKIQNYTRQECRIRFSN